MSLSVLDLVMGYEDQPRNRGCVHIMFHIGYSAYIVYHVYIEKQMQM